jgi:hypothetical protein
MPAATDTVRGALAVGVRKEPCHRRYNCCRKKYQITIKQKPCAPGAHCSHQSPSWCRFTTRVRLRIMNRPGFIARLLTVCTTLFLMGRSHRLAAFDAQTISRSLILHIFSG